MILFPNVVHILALINSHDKIGCKITCFLNNIIHYCFLFFQIFPQMTIGDVFDTPNKKAKSGPLFAGTFLRKLQIYD